MIETVVITKRIVSGIIGWVYVNEFDLSAKLLFEGVECDEVVAFDDKVFSDDAVFVAFECANFTF